MKKGFTLIEVSIVLVIIGLLLTGVVATQSMLSAAKLDKLVMTIQKFDVAVANFKTKFNTVPGDSRVLGCGGGWNLCDDGMVEDAIGRPRPDSIWNAQVWGGEWSQFWIQLQKSGFTYLGKTFVESPLTADGILITGNAINTPAADMVNKTSAIMPIAVGGQEPELEQGALYYEICTFGHDVPWPGSSNTYCGYGSASVPPVTAMALDNKLDDGKSRYGNIIAYDSAWQSCNTTYSPTNQPENRTADYWASAPDAKTGCVMFIKTGSTQ